MDYYDFNKAIKSGDAETLKRGIIKCGDVKDKLREDIAKIQKEINEIDSREKALKKELSSRVAK
ncbi:MAG: hypothetical protein Q7S87_04755 [Agitococcus sp.]|nr:hypothetical protein [Agitococcus sp.]